MFTALILVTLTSIIVSAMCSLMEAALFAVPLPHVRFRSEQGSRAAKKLLGFKEEMGPPISAILILNTISNTVGAALAGAIVAHSYGEKAVLLFSACFTLLILYLSEIIPKQVGAEYSKTVSEAIAIPLSILIKLLRPVIFLTEGTAGLLSRDEGEPSASLDEVLSMAEIGREEGVLDHLEGSVIRNVVGLDRLLVKDILTPRVVVFRMADDLVLRDIKNELTEWNHTRVPLYPSNEPDNITRYVIQRDLFRIVLKGDDDIMLRELSRPLRTVTGFMRADKLLLQMFEQRENICSVVDEHGGFAGLVTIEDIIEEIVGREIVDEYDSVSDLRTFARILKIKRNRNKIK